MNALQESKASEKVHFNLLVLQGLEEYAQLEWLITSRNVSYLLFASEGAWLYRYIINY